MDVAALIPAWLDQFLISPFRWPHSPQLAMWLGSALLCAYCTFIGECTATLLYWCNRRYYAEQQDALVRAHNLSVDALQSGDKASYTAINKEAHELFGKTFFAQAAMACSSLWPVPLALAWMALRFEGIEVHTLPFTDRPLGYVFVFFSLYIPCRIVFSRLKKRLPFFRNVEWMKEEARNKRGALKSFFRRNA